MRLPIAIVAALLCLGAGADGELEPRADGWIQTSAVVVLCAVVIQELRSIRKLIEEDGRRLARYAGEGRRLRSVSDSPTDRSGEG